MIETGITFGDVHSYYDLNLILSGSEIPPAKPKTNFLDIPGADGSVDLTESLGEVKFYDRDCKFTFTMNPAEDLSDEAFEEKKTEVSNALNGKRLKITLDKDDGYYYLGRCEVSEYLSDRRIRQIVVTAKVEPYKYKQGATGLTFELDGTEKEVVLKNSRMTTTLAVICWDGSITIEHRSTVYEFEEGIHKTSDIFLVEGNNYLYFKGTGLVSISYQEGEL